MNKRGFLKNLGAIGIGVAILPKLALAETPKRKIYKVELPAFMMFYFDGECDMNGKLIAKMRAQYVQTFNCSLKELCRRHPHDEIFFYEEKEVILYPNQKVKWVRARVVKKEPNVEIIGMKNYEI